MSPPIVVFYVPEISPKVNGFVTLSGGGGGSRKDHLVTLLRCHYWLLGVGVKGKSDNVTLYHVFFGRHPLPKLDFTRKLLYTSYQYQQYLSCYSTNFDRALNIGFWDHLEQIQTITVTFILSTFVLATFVHIRKISAIIVPILTKLVFVVLNTLGPKFCLSQTFLEPTYCLNPTFY